MAFSANQKSSLRAPANQRANLKYQFGISSESTRLKALKIPIFLKLNLNFEPFKFSLIYTVKITHLVMISSTIEMILAQRIIAVPKVLILLNQNKKVFGRHV